MCAPSGPVDGDALDASLAWLERQGHPVVVAKNVRARAGYLAGNDSERLADLESLLRDPSVGAILCARGGYGVSRYLARLDADELRRARKLVVGYSDATHLLCYLQARAGLASLHGPMLERTDVTPEARARELALMRGEPEGLEPLAGRALRGGSAEGPLVGGNLKMLHSSVGTPWEPALDGAILFFEEISEAPYAIDRALVHLREAGLLARVRGVAVGQLVNCESTRYPGASAPDAVREILGAAVRGPIVVDLPFGHVADNRALAVGVRARLDGDRGLLTGLEPVVETER
ncbi:MAG TPA: LD-carboxypeptidase [Myxococcota bacterium]|nr:LD-carboxypeptidase [Myxococcota bacterium]